MSLSPSLADQESFRWSDLAQIAFLDALVTKSGLTAKEIAFQGGTSLHLCWRSPRKSEDLDFLIARDDPYRRLSRVMPAIKRRMERFIAGQEPSLPARAPGMVDIEITDKTRNPNRMMVFDIRLSHPSWPKKVRVKTEFWRVPADYLEQYDTVLRMPTWQSHDLIARIESASPINTATPVAILADKMVALAYRSRVKWRDIFDVWWLDQQMPANHDTMLVQLAERTLRHAQAYGGPEGGVAAGLRHLLAQKEDLMRARGCDLDRWLPDPVAKMFLPERLPEMVTTVLRYADGMLTALAAQAGARQEAEPSNGGPRP